MVIYMIGIRADANEIIAAGHIMRCITIAKQLKIKGEKVLFFTADEYAVPMLKQAGMEYICLHSAWDRLKEELPVLLTELERAGCKKLLVDSYQATADYLGELKREYKVIYIDDMFETVYPVDMIINYNAYYTRFPYREAYDGNTKLLLGPSYVPLREEFSAERESTAAVDKSAVLLSCGGGDAYNTLAGILALTAAGEKFAGIVFHTVVGRFNRNAGELEELARKHPQIKLHYDVTNMADLMGRCNAAVSAAGTVLYELCAMQVPTVFFVCADNQTYDSDFFAEEERMLFAGDIRTDRNGCIHNICDGLEQLLQDTKLQEKMKRMLHEVTDGNGSIRIAEEMVRL